MIENINRIFKQATCSYGALQNNRKHQFAASQALSLYQSEAIYTFIPKNACTTMRVSLAMENGCIGSLNDFNWIHKNNATFKATFSELIRAKYTFVILRSPLQRLASVYLDKIVDRTGVAWVFYDLIQRKISLEEITFRKFVELVTKDHIIREDIHWRPQVDFLVYEKYDDYFTLENFLEAVPIIEEKTGMKIHDARSLTKHGTDQYEMLDDKCYADTSPIEIFQMKQEGRIPSHDSLYDRLLEKKAETAYEDDILLYTNCLDN